MTFVPYSTPDAENQSHADQLSPRNAALSNFAFTFLPDHRSSLTSTSFALALTMEAGTSGNAAVKEGYDFNFIDKLPERLKCPICLCAMRNPVQTKCGHRFCNNCLYGSFRYYPLFNVQCRPVTLRKCRLFVFHPVTIV